MIARKLTFWKSNARLRAAVQVMQEVDNSVPLAEQSSGTAQNLLDVIMQAYRHRMERAQNLQSGY